jgi:hypothetical protein
MIIPRTIEPEWLDELAPADPRAVGSRRDLQRINALMMNKSLVIRELLRANPVNPPQTIAEIGAGDGSFMLQVAGQLPARWRRTGLLLLDQQSLLGVATRESFAAIGWTTQAVTADVFEWLARPAAPVFDVIVANLFLHHFDAARLAQLLALVAPRTRVLIACEPRRSRGALVASQLLGIIGCNDVTRHDAVVSVHAGFNDQELSGLWPDHDGWQLREHAHGLFSHCFVATRIDVAD